MARGITQRSSNRGRAGKLCLYRPHPMAKDCGIVVGWKRIRGHAPSWDSQNSIAQGLHKHRCRTIVRFSIRSLRLLWGRAGKAKAETRNMDVRSAAGNL